MNIFSSFMVTIRFESEKTIKTKSFVEMNIVIYTETQCRAVTLEFGAETTPLPLRFWTQNRNIEIIQTFHQ